MKKGPDYLFRTVLLFGKHYWWDMEDGVLFLRKAWWVNP